MTAYNILDRTVVDRWGDKEARAEVQAVHDKDHDYYSVRVCYYQDNGRFGQSAPTIDPDPETAGKVCEAFQTMAERAREAHERARLNELSYLVDEIGYDRAKELLEQEAGRGPTTVEALTAMLPERLATATTSIIKDHVNEENRYKRTGKREGEELILKFISEDSNKVIYEVSVYLPDTERVNHRVDIRCQTPQNELKRIAQLRDVEDDAVDITEYVEFDTHQTKETTRRGADAGQKTADEVIGPNVAKFVDQAYDEWGTKSEENPNS